MPRRYVNITEKVDEKIGMTLGPDFVISTDPNKTIVIRKVRLINSIIREGKTSLFCSISLIIKRE